MRGLGEGGVRCRFIAVLPVVADVVRHFVVNCGLAGIGRMRGIDCGGQYVETTSINRRASFAVLIESAITPRSGRQHGHSPQRHAEPQRRHSAGRARDRCSGGGYAGATSRPYRTLVVHSCQAFDAGRRRANQLKRTLKSSSLVDRWATAAHASLTRTGPDRVRRADPGSGHQSRPPRRKGSRECRSSRSSCGIGPDLPPLWQILRGRTPSGRTMGASAAVVGGRVPGRPAP